MWTMAALVSVLVLALAGPDATPAPLSPAADNDAIYAAIVAGDPTLTTSPEPLGSLVAATELAEKRLRQAGDADDAEDLLMLVAQGRRAAHERTGDAVHLCRLVAAADHVLGREALPLRLSAAASDFREEARQGLGSQRCEGAPPPAPAQGSPPPSPPDRGAVVVTPKPEPPPIRPVDRHDRRRLQAGVGTLVPGLVMFAPMAALLAVRVDARGDLADLNAATAMRPATDTEIRQADALHDRFTTTTVAAAALGVTGGALVVTGAVLLAVKRRSTRAALAPWGGGGIGGLVLQGRF